ncbi:uncharacterized protein [Canis lupus baileyi]|uniref:uncharacterized protein n=1 Tax=Canis lupus baileyi TaxID=143281 RepID=UPI003B975B55
MGQGYRDPGGQSMVASGPPLLPLDPIRAPSSEKAHWTRAPTTATSQGRRAARLEAQRDTNGPAVPACPALTPGCPQPPSPYRRGTVPSPHLALHTLATHMPISQPQPPAVSSLSGEVAGEPGPASPGCRAFPSALPGGAAQGDGRGDPERQVLRTGGQAAGRRAPPAPRCPRVTQHPRGCTTPTSRPRSKEPQVHPERQSLGRRQADAKSQPSCRLAVLPHLPAPPGCSAQAPTASGGGQGCPGWEQRQTWGRGGAHGCPELPLLSGAPGRQHAHPPSARQVPALKLDRGPAEDARPQAGAKGWPLPAHQVSRGGAKRKAGPGVVLRDTRWTTGGEQAASAPRSILRATLPPSRNTSASPCAPTVPGRAPDPRRPTQPAHLAWASAQEPRAPTQGRDSANLGLTRVGGAGGWAAGWEDWLLGERWPGGARWGAPGCDTVTVGAGGRSGSPHAENLPLTRQPRPPPPRQASDLALVQENEVT